MIELITSILDKYPKLIDYGPEFYRRDHRIYMELTHCGLGVYYSLEAAADLRFMMGINTENYLADFMGYEMSAALENWLN